MSWRWLPLWMAICGLSGGSALALDDTDPQYREIGQRIQAIGASHPTGGGELQLPALETADPATPVDNPPLEQPFAYGAYAHHYDYLRPFDEHQETSAGLPLIYCFKTEHAWLERKVQLDYYVRNGTHNGAVDEGEFKFELFWAFNNRLAFVLQTPFRTLQPDGASRAYGFGDLTVGLQYMAFHGESTLLAFGLNISSPTGDDSRDLGVGHATIEPALFYYLDLGGNFALQADLSLADAISVDVPETKFDYNAGLTYTFAGTADWRLFRYMTPVSEFNGYTLLNGPDSHRSVLNYTGGLRWIMRDHDQCGIGFSVPMIGDRDFNHEVIISYLIHF